MKQARRFTESDVSEVRDRTDLRDLISAHVDLRHAGGAWKGLCPFHDERTPSFVVTPARGTFHCFGCGEHGDAIAFVMAIEHLPFPDAVRSLADRAGMTLAEVGVTDEDMERANTTRRSLGVIAATDEFYREMLTTPAAATAVQELASRGFTREDAVDAGCGWAPPEKERLVEWLAARDFTVEDAVTAGVLAESTHGGSPYPFLRNRLTWPIHNATGAPVGWGGRRLSEEQHGKYINSAASPWFDKSTLLYGWVTARKAAARTGRIVVAEGYTDVMALRRSGVEEAVAACGTAFGAAHMRLIERSLPEETRVVFCFDGDTAGEKATMATWQESTSLLHRVEGVFLTEGDPCDVWRRDGDGALLDILTASRPLTELVFDRIISRGNTDTPDGRSRVAREVQARLGDIPDEVMRAGYADWAANRLGVSPGVLSAPSSATSSPSSAGAVTAPVPDGASPAGQVQARDAMLQRRIATRLCTSPEGAAKWLDNIVVDHFTDALALSVVEVVVAAAQDCDPAAMTGAQWVGRLMDTAPDVVGHRISAVVTHEESRPDPDVAPDHELLVVGPLHLKHTRLVERADEWRQRAAHADSEEDIALALLQHQEAREDVEGVGEELRRMTQG